MLPESKDHQHVSLTFEIPSICSPTEMETPIVTSLFRNWAQVLILKKKNPNKFRGPWLAEQWINYDNCIGTNIVPRNMLS